ncbi:MAG: lasso RiPP family leader peptide-containing protein [Acidobacteria bacterium]|nr:lasso RiPP family leader peptide-containing protein [Acidobacteriota bacterium]
MQSEPENTTKENEKKSYRTPKLIKHGTIEEITGSFDSDAQISGLADDG